MPTVRGLKSRSRVGSQSLHVEQIQSDSNFSNGMEWPIDSVAINLLTSHLPFAN